MHTISKISSISIIAPLYDQWKFLDLSFFKTTLSFYNDEWRITVAVTLWFSVIRHFYLLKWQITNTVKTGLIYFICHYDNVNIFLALFLRGATSWEFFFKIILESATPFGMTCSCVCEMVTYSELRTIPTFYLYNDI